MHFCEEVHESNKILDFDSKLRGGDTWIAIVLLDTRNRLSDEMHTLKSVNLLLHGYQSISVYIVARLLNINIVARLLNINVVARLLNINVPSR